MVCFWLVWDVLPHYCFYLGVFECFEFPICLPCVGFAPVFEFVFTCSLWNVLYTVVAGFLVYGCFCWTPSLICLRICVNLLFRRVLIYSVGLVFRCYFCLDWFGVFCR